MTPIRRRRAVRSVKKGLTVGAAGAGIALLADRPLAFARAGELKGGSGKLSKGDAALLRFAAAAETLESDFWLQYNELGGIQDSEVPGGSGNPTYTAKLQVLDGDFPQYTPRQHGRRDHSLHLPQRVPKVEGSGSSQSGAVSHLAGQHCHRIQRKAAPHKSHATHPGHELVDSLPQQQ